MLEPSLLAPLLVPLFQQHGLVTLVGETRYPFQLPDRIFCVTTLLPIHQRSWQSE